jgi:hypothetical protein
VLTPYPSRIRRRPALHNVLAIVPCMRARRTDQFGVSAQIVMNWQD